MTPAARPAGSRPVEGFVYVATGAFYRQEAAAAAAHLRRTNPNKRICLITDRAEGPVFWDDCVILEQPVFGFGDKLSMALNPYDRFVYLDSDTLVLDSLDEIFTLLDRFDFAGHQLFEGHDYRLPNVPDAFAEIQGGVVAFRRSPAVLDFFRRWRELFEQSLPRDRSLPYRAADVSDQKSQRIALYESALSLAILGPEYNFIPTRVNFACAKIRILHGRGPLESLAPRLNRRLGNRAFLPRLGVVVSMDTPASELGRLWRGVSLQLVRAAGTALTPLALRNWLRRSRLVRRLFLPNDFVVQSPDHAKKWQEPTAPGADQP